MEEEDERKKTTRNDQKRKGTKRTKVERWSGTQRAEMERKGTETERKWNENLLKIAP